MNLFINAISKKGALILFDNDSVLVSMKYINILWNESEKLANIVDSFILGNNLSYNDLENLVVVNWPGSFTSVRIIVLIANTINFIIKKNITSLSFFDLFENYPIIKSSSKRDLFVKFGKTSKIELVKNEDFICQVDEGMCALWDVYDESVFNFPILGEVDYERVIKNIRFSKESFIRPLYIKKPNIS